MKKLFLLLFATFCFLGACGAEESLSSGELVSVNPSSGQLQYELSLYTINDPDFTWPISLTYTSDGFHPYDYSFPVGSGWNLMAGGTISRNVVGLHDDLDTIISALNHGDYGLFTGIRYPYLYANNLGSPYEYPDCGSDIYSYTFGSYSGSFVFDSVGNPQIISGDFVYIDASGVSLQKNWSDYGSQNWLSSNDLHSSYFVITTLDGYKYYFGSTPLINALEYGGSTDIGCSLTITSWYLQRIEAPNGSTLVFHYRTPNQALWKYDRAYKWMETHSPPMEVDGICSDTLSMGLFYPKYHPDGGTPQLYRYTLLDSITNPNTGLRVLFSYSWNNNKVFNQTIVERTTIKADSLKPFLTSMQVKIGNETRKNWSFTYQNVNNDIFSHRFLSSATDGCDNTHSFTYDLTNLLNLPSSYIGYYLDEYGHYTEHPNFGTLINSTNSLGAINIYSYTPIEVDSVRLFSLEQGQWVSKTVFYDKPICHTVKLSNITVSNGESVLYKKHYNYGETDTVTGQSPSNPGVPRSNGVLTLEAARYNATGPAFSFLPFLRLHASASPITFSDVTESVFDASDELLRYTHYTYQTNQLVYTIPATQIHYKIMTYMQPNIWYRLLRNTKEYNASHQLISEKTNEYTGAVTNNRQFYYHRKFWHEIPSFKYHCTKRIETSHDVTATASFTFDSKFRLRKQTQTKGIDTLFTRYVYPDDISLSQHGGLPSGTDSCFWGTLFLASKNLIGTPIETYGGYMKNGIEYTTSGVLELHKVDWTQLPHGQILANFTKETRTLHLSSSIASYSPVYAANFALIYNTNYDMVSVSHYTFWNRLNWEQNVSSALRTYYQWSSDKMYPISKTIGGRTWQYTYSPYLGITSETDPRGTITGYQYDTCGRLIEKYLWRNNQKEILEHYIYH